MRPAPAARGPAATAGPAPLQSTVPPKGVRKRAATPAAVRWLFDHRFVEGAAVRAVEGSARLRFAEGPRVMIHTLPHALAFDAARETVEFEGELPMLDLEQGVSIELWAQIDAVADAGAILSLSEAQRGWLLGFEADRFVFRPCGAAAAAATAADSEPVALASSGLVEPGRWFHVVVILGERQARLYVNGVLEAARELGSGFDPAVARLKRPALRIASSDCDGTSPAAGLFHEIAVYDKAIAEWEVSTRYEAKRRLMEEWRPMRGVVNVAAEWLFTGGGVGHFVVMDMVSLNHLRIEPVDGRWAEFDPNVPAIILEPEGARIRTPIRLSGPRLPVEGVSVEAWVRPAEVERPGVIMSTVSGERGAPTGWILWIEAGRYHFGLCGRRGRTWDGGLAVITSSVPAEKRWQHVAATYDGWAQRIYVDGRLVAAGREAWGEVFYSGAGFAAIGRDVGDAAGRGFAGMIQRITLYDWAASADHLRARYESDRKQFPALRNEPPGSAASAPAASADGLP